jgi:regulator of sirC expression with transglutaminase-like and TPR domain
MLQVALPIEQGNSGGPLLDMQGRVHGLLTLKSLKTENLGFAIAVNSLKPLLEKPNPIPMSRWLTIGAMDPEEWTILPGGRWRQRAGQVAVDGRGGGFGGRALCLATEATPAVPFEVAVQVKFTPADGAAGLVFHSDGGDKHYGFYPSNGGVRLTRFDGPDFNSWAVLREIRTPALRKETWNSLRIRVEAERILCYLNGEMVMETKDVTYTSGKVGLCKFRQTDAEFKGFRMGQTLSEPIPSVELVSRVTTTIDRLGADDLPVTTAVESLAAEDANVIDLLERQAKSLELRAAQVRRLASDIHTVKTLSDLEKVVKSDSVNLLRGALLIARLDNPELDIDGYVQEVDRHAKRVKGGVAADATEDDLFSALNRYLFEEQGFHGSRTDSGNRSNSYVNEVLDDREGLPITLTVVYLEIASRLGLNMVGVGMPGHFLARHEPKLGTVQLIDVFDRGRRIMPADAKAKFEDISESPWRESYLEAIPHTATLIRILRNLFVTANEARELDRMLRYTEAILVLTPDSVQDHMFRARLCYETQRWQQARNEIEWLLKHDSDIYRDQIEILARAIARDSPK